MKYGKHLTIIGIGFVLALLVGCASIPSSSVSTRSHYTGDGGKGISLAILAPKANGLADNQNYLPALVQGEFVSNFSNYSAISVMDRENLDNIYAELLSGYYDDEDEAGLDLGHLSATDYIMNGSITKTATGYSLQIQIIKTANKLTAASYSGTCTFAELDNLTGIHRASSDLLQKMGVILTEQAKTELAGAATTNHISGQTALAKGIIAQRNGTLFEAMSYYYDAAAFNPQLSEAQTRFSTIAADIRSGNIGENIRNDIQNHDRWLEFMQECERYFTDHLPVEIIYNPRLTQNDIDYSKKTADLTFEVGIRQSSNITAVQTLLEGLNRTGRRDAWGFTNWPMTSQAFVARPPRETNRFNEKSEWEEANPVVVSFALVNDENETISVCRYNIPYKIRFTRNKIDGHVIFANIVTLGLLSWGIDRNDDFHSDGTKLENESWNGSMTFKDVDAYRITDRLTVKVLEINGQEAESATQNGYVRITSTNKSINKIK
jgi:TolB-like protein